MKSWILAVILAATSAVFGAEASSKHWRSVMKAADEARQNLDLEKATSLLEGAAAEAAALSKESSAENSHALGVVFLLSGETARAMSTADEALEKLGPEPKGAKQKEWRGNLLNLKMLVLRATLKSDEALKTAEETRTAMERAGMKFNSQLYFLNMFIGEQHARKKNYAEAEKAFLAALKLTKSRDILVQQEWSGLEAERVMYTVQNSTSAEVPVALALGDLMMDQDKTKEAEEYYKTALNLSEQYFGKKHQNLAFALGKMARVHLKSDRRKEFESDIQRSYEIAVKETGLKPWVADPLWFKLEVDLKEGNAVALKETTRKINDVFAKQNFDAKWIAEGALQASFAEKTNDWERAAEVQRVFRETALAVNATPPAKAGRALMGFGELSQEKGQLDLARVNYEELLKLGEKAGDKMLQVGAMDKLADLSIAEKKNEEALALMQKITAILAEKYGDDTRVAAAMSREAATLKAMGRDQQAAEMEAKAKEVVKKSFLRR